MRLRAGTGHAGNRCNCDHKTKLTTPRVHYRKPLHGPHSARPCRPSLGHHDPVRSAVTQPRGGGRPQQAHCSGPQGTTKARRSSVESKPLQVQRPLRDKATPPAMPPETRLNDRHALPGVPRRSPSCRQHRDPFLLSKCPHFVSLRDYSQRRGPILHDRKRASFETRDSPYGARRAWTRETAETPSPAHVMASGRDVRFGKNRRSLLLMLHRAVVQLSGAATRSVLVCRDQPFKTKLRHASVPQ